MFHHRNRHINTQQKRLIRLLALLSVRTYIVFAPRAVPRYSCCTHPGMKRLGIFFHTYLGYKTSRVDEEHENSGTSCEMLSVGQYGPRDRLLPCRGASGSAHEVTHTRCLTNAWKIYLLRLVACLLAGCLLNEGAR